MANKIISSVIMNDLFENNIYQKEKQLKDNLDQIRKEIQKRHPQDIKFWEFDKVIAIKQYPKSYDIDNIGLNNYLYDLGVLIEVAYINEKYLSHFQLEKIKDFQNEDEFFIKFSPKRGLVEKNKKNYQHLNDKDLIDLWYKTKLEHQDLENIINEEKQKMLDCDELNKNKKVSTEFGSVSLIKKSPSYNIEKIYEELGPEFLIKIADVNFSSLEKFKNKGIVTDMELDNYRKLIKVGERYIVLTKEAYQKQYNLLNIKKHKQAKNLAELWNHKKHI